MPARTASARTAGFILPPGMTVRLAIIAAPFVIWLFSPGEEHMDGHHTELFGKNDVFEIASDLWLTKAYQGAIACETAAFPVP
jgi:hypothetical protein